jgi:hypothetical protein
VKINPLVAALALAQSQSRKKPISDRSIEPTFTAYQSENLTEVLEFVG